MMVIFAFSAQTAEESTMVSNSVGIMVGNLIVPGFDGWNMGQQLEFAEQIEYGVRKCAHWMEYALLGVLLVGALVDTGKVKSVEMNSAELNTAPNRNSRRKQILASTAIGICYACSDEFHQLFVPGRSGQVTDVLLDSFGVIVGVILAKIVMDWIAVRIK